MFHPATLLVAWSLAVIALQALDISVAFVVLTLLGALGTSRDLLRRLIWRSRWLFTSIVLLFLWMTPGFRLPGLPGRLGMTEEGMRLAGAHTMHLLSLLVLVALLMTRMKAPAIVAGLHTLFRPLGLIPDLPRRLALRLMLTLEYAGAGQACASAPQLELVHPRVTVRDILLLIVLSALAISAVFPQ